MTTRIDKHAVRGSAVFLEGDTPGARVLVADTRMVCVREHTSASVLVVEVLSSPHYRSHVAAALGWFGSHRFNLYSNAAVRGLLKNI